MKTFKDCLLEKIKYHLESPDCRYNDNHISYYKSGDKKALEADSKLLESLTIPSFDAFLKIREQDIKNQIKEKKYLFDLLEDEYSKEILVTVALYKLLSRLFVKFPCYLPNYHEKLSALLQKTSCNDNSNFLDSFHQNTVQGLSLQELSCIGINIKGYFGQGTAIGYTHEPQYNYLKNNANIRVEEGDYAFDCGACSGDTALYFAHLAGESGRVFSFEPHPEYFKILSHNVEMNPHLSRQISTVNRAVSDKPGQELRFNLYGAGSSVQADTHHQPYEITVESTSIDHEAEEKNISKIDFIKMDIEGSELDGLVGAQESIKRHKPKLAICLYHKYGDFHNIPSYIHNLDLGYKFYLNHHYINEWETVLYASAR